MPEARTLIALPYSPWSERARWALLHHRLRFDEKAHLPMLGEPWLRWKAGHLTRKTSVPLLLADGRAFADSLLIVRHTDETGEGDPLWPASRDRDLRLVSEQTEPLFQAGRAFGIGQLFDNDDAARAMLPRPLRSLPGGVAVSRLGARFVARKYGVAFEGAVERMRGGLLQIRERLDGKDYVFPDFSYADILFATALQFVSPVSGDYVRLASAVRNRWRIPELETEFSDLCEWRDRLYEKHRPQRESSH